MRAKLEGLLGDDFTPRAHGDGGEDGGSGVTSMVSYAEKALGDGGGGEGAEGSIAAKIKRSVQLQKVFEEIVAVVKKAAGGSIEKAVEDEVGKLASVSKGGGRTSARKWRLASSNLGKESASYLGFEIRDPRRGEIIEGNQR